MIETVLQRNYAIDKPSHSFIHDVILDSKRITHGVKLQSKFCVPENVGAKTVI